MATLNEFKRYLQVDITDTSQDTFYTELLTRAEQKIANFFGGELYQTVYTDEMLDGNKILFPKHYPIISVEHLYIDDNELTEDTDFYVYDTYIYLNTDIEGKKNITLDYTAGYDDIPEDIGQAIILTAANLLKLSADLQPNQLVDTRITKEVQEILAPYLRIVL